jgi:hypothetical protein
MRKLYELAYLKNSKKTLRSTRISKYTESCYYISGEWLLVIVYMFRDQLQNLLVRQGVEGPGEGVHNVTTPSATLLESLKLQNIHWFVLMAVSTSFVMYYGLAYGWHYYYYVSRRHLV